MSECEDVGDPFGADERFVIGGGDAVGAMRKGKIDNLLRRYGLFLAMNAWIFSDLRNFPILAKRAFEIAAEIAETEDVIAWVKMIERLLFVGIQREAANGTVRDLQFAVYDATAATDACMAFFQMTIMSAAFTIHN